MIIKIKVVISIFFMLFCFH